jgi:hypothetical protein
MTDDWVFNESTKTAPLRPSLCRLIMRDFCEMHAGSVEVDGDGLLLKCAPEMLIAYAAWRVREFKDQDGKQAVTGWTKIRVHSTGVPDEDELDTIKKKGPQSA